MSEPTYCRYQIQDPSTEFYKPIDCGLIASAMFNGVPHCTFHHEYATDMQRRTIKARRAQELEARHRRVLWPMSPDAQSHLANPHGQAACGKTLELSKYETKIVDNPHYMVSCPGCMDIETEDSSRYMVLAEWGTIGDQRRKEARP